MKRVEVAIALVCRPESPHVMLITRRPSSTVYGGYWEFPGGKITPGESSADAAIREAREELGIEVEPIEALPVFEHTYEHPHVVVHPFLCRHVGGQPQNIDVAEHQWVEASRISDFKFLPANKGLVEALCVRFA